MAEQSSTACSEAILTLKISEVVLQGMVQEFSDTSTTL